LIGRQSFKFKASGRAESTQSISLRLPASLLDNIKIEANRREIGCTDIIVIEARNIYDQFYRSRTVREVARLLRDRFAALPRG